MKLIMIDGIPHRMRRGKLVRIPDNWFGKFPTKKTISMRQSKLVRRGRPKPTERLVKVTNEDDVDKHLRRTSKRWARDSH